VQLLLQRHKRINKLMSFTPERLDQALNILRAVPLESDSTGLRAGKPELFLQTPFSEGDPSFSPDGRWLAYDSDESGAFQIYVRAFPDKGGKWQVSNTGGEFPEWSRDGRELFFRSLDNQIMVASYSVKGDSFVAEKSKLWSEKEHYPEVDRLKQVKGVGTLIALTFVLTVDDPNRFQRSRDVGCYMGLRPGRRNSGKSEPQLHISKEGDRYMRTLLVKERTTFSVRSDPTVIYAGGV
jgi:hypothetical protein